MLTPKIEMKCGGISSRRKKLTHLTKRFTRSVNMRNSGKKRRLDKANNSKTRNTKRRRRSSLLRSRKSNAFKTSLKKSKHVWKSARRLICSEQPSENTNQLNIRKLMSFVKSYSVASLAIKNLQFAILRSLTSPKEKSFCSDWVNKFNLVTRIATWSWSTAICRRVKPRLELAIHLPKLQLKSSRRRLPRLLKTPN